MASYEDLIDCDYIAKNLEDIIRVYNKNYKIDKIETEKYIDWSIYTEYSDETKISYIRNARKDCIDFRFDKEKKEWHHIKYEHCFENCFSLYLSSKHINQVWCKNYKKGKEYSVSLFKKESHIGETIYEKIDILNFLLENYYTKPYKCNVYFRNLQKKAFNISKKVRDKKKIFEVDKRLYTDIIFHINKYI